MACKHSFDSKFVGVWMPKKLLLDIDTEAAKRLSNRSQIIREAALKWFG